MDAKNISQPPQETDMDIAERDAVLWVVASLIDSNGNTRNVALRRKQVMLAALIKELQKKTEFAGRLPDTEAELIIRASLLQDIGKSGVPDRILLKPGKLDPKEFELVKTHPTIGFEALKEAEKILGGKASGFLRYAQEIAHCHQEKWDGSGYPRHLAGEAIPLSARLATIIDVYNAIISKRVYKPALPHEDAIKIIWEGRGRDFDPQVTDAFHAISSEILAISKKFADHYDEQLEINRLASAAAEEINLS
jgi:putative two-component system response regulator